MKKSRKVLGAVATVTVFGVFTRLLSFLFKIYLSRTLGAEAIGQYQIAISVFYLFAAFSASGIPLVVSRKIAEQNAIQGKRQMNIFTAALLTGVVISLVLILCLALFNKHLSALFSDPMSHPLFLVMIPALLSTTVYSIIRSWFWGRKDFTAFSITETVEEGLRILFSILLVSGIISGISGAYAVAIAFTISDILVAILLFILFFAKGGNLKTPSNVKEILLPALPVTAMRLFASLIGTFVALILPARLMGFGMNSSEATAMYGRISGMANPLLLAPNAIIASLAIVLVPEMSENGIKKDFRALNRNLNNGLNFAFLISGIFMVVFIALGEEITVILYDDAISGQYLQYATYIMLPMALSGLTQSALNSVGKEMVAFKNYLLGTVPLILAVLFLPKYLGIYSVAVANMVSFLTTSLLNVYSLKKHISFRFGFLKYLVMVILFIFPSAFLTDSLNALLSPYLKLFGTMLAALFGVIMYGGLCLSTELVDIKGFISLRRSKRA